MPQPPPPPPQHDRVRARGALAEICVRELPSYTERRGCCRQILTTCHTTCHTTDGGVVSAGGRGRHNVTEGRTRVTVIEAVKQRGSGELTLVPTLYPRAPPRRASFVVFSVSSRFYRAVGAASRLAGATHRADSSIVRNDRRARSRVASCARGSPVNQVSERFIADTTCSVRVECRPERPQTPGSGASCPVRFPRRRPRLLKTTTATSIRRVHRLIKNQRQTFSNTPQPSAGKITETRERCETHHVRWNSTRKIRVSRAISGSCTSLASSSTKMALAS